MKTTALLAALALLGLNAVAATPTETMAAFHAALAAGARTAALALLSPAVVIYESGYVERSRDEYASHHLAGDMAFCQATRRKVLKHSERIDGSSATVLEETETSGAFKGKPANSLGLETTLLEKNGDGWLIVHVHWSSRKTK